MSQLCVVSASDNLTLLIAHCLGWFGWDGGMDSLFSGLFSTGQMALVIAKQPSIGTSNYSSTFFRNCLFLAARQLQIAFYKAWKQKICAQNLAQTQLCAKQKTDTVVCKTEDRHSCVQLRRQTQTDGRIPIRLRSCTVALKRCSHQTLAVRTCLKTRRAMQAQLHAANNTNTM